ncbi:MAG: tyrosine-type recombinase/integrase [Ardenticatenaceae bacterium]
MTRRANGEGTIRKRPDGRWEASLRVGETRRYVYGPSKAEVAAQLHLLTRQVQEVGSLPPATRLTVAEYLDQWLAQAAPRLRPTTRELYGIVARCHIAPVLGTVKLARLTPLAVARAYALLAEKGASARTRHRAHRFLHKALADAVRWGLLLANPCERVDAPRYQAKPKTLWTPAEVRAFLAALSQGQGGLYGPLFGFLLASGCRRGEALGLRWDDYDAHTGCVRIERQVTWVGGRPVEQPPKTKAGSRTLTLPAWGVALLKQQRAQVLRWRLKGGAVPRGRPRRWDDGGRVFPSSTGKTPEPTSLRGALRALCDRLELPRLTLHDLRHLSISLLAMAGVPVKVAQQRAGHSSPSVTLSIYTHVLGDGDALAVEALDALAH